MEDQKLKKLEDVLINLGSGRKIIDHKTTRLTAPGENYGSTMLAVDVKVLNEQTSREETLHIVAKLLPINEMAIEVFNVQVTFRNEVGFYKEIVPLLTDFQKNGTSGIGAYFAKFFGSRISIDPSSNKVDENAVLLLENLKLSGFTTVKRTIGFDLEQARLVLSSLAKFHATTLAFKLKNPEEFEKKIKCHLADFLPKQNDEFSGHMVNSTIKMLKENYRCVLYLDRVSELLGQQSDKVVREPFATVTHNDCWTNNVMLKFENEKPVAIKFVDFQVIEYKSPCRDLLFLLFSSVRLDVLTDGVSIDALIDLYYQTFIEELKQLKCEVAPFNRDFFNKELELASKESEYAHIITMHNPIYGPEGGLPQSEDGKKLLPMDMPASPYHKERVQFITLEFGKRGWL